MKIIFLFSFLLFTTAFVLPARAQSKAITINGRITSFEESLPLEGVSVQVKNTNNATGTQADGSFSLSIQPGEKTLLFFLAGYEKQEVTITGAKEYNIVLKRAEGLQVAEKYQAANHNKMLK